MPFEFISKFPELFRTKNDSVAWPDTVEKGCSEHALLLTVSVQDSEPNVRFSYTGDPNVVAHFLISVIMTQPELAIALLNNLSEDPDVIAEILHNPSSN